MAGLNFLNQNGLLSRSAPSGASLHLIKFIVSGRGNLPLKTRKGGCLVHLLCWNGTNVRSHGTFGQVCHQPPNSVILFTIRFEAYYIHPTMAQRSDDCFGYGEVCFRCA
jgi:hypothetical protein